VFAISSIAIFFVVIITLALQNEVEPIFQGIFDYLTTNLSWVFLLATNIFVILCVVLIFTPLSKGTKSVVPRPHPTSPTLGGFRCCSLRAWVLA